MRFYRIDFLIIFFLKFYVSYCSDIFANDSKIKSEKNKKNILKSSKKIKPILKNNKSKKDKNKNNKSKKDKNKNNKSKKDKNKNNKSKKDKNKNNKNNEGIKVTFNENVDVLEYDKNEIASNLNIDIKNKNSKYCRQDEFLKNTNPIKRIDSKRDTKKDYIYPYILKKKKVCGCCCKN